MPVRSPTQTYKHGWAAHHTTIIPSHLMTVMQTHTGKHALPVIWGNTKTNLPPYEADTLNHAREVTHTNLQTWLGCTSHHHHPQPSNDSHTNTHTGVSLTGKKKMCSGFPKKPAGTPCAQPWLVAVGGWRLTAVGGWRLAVGNWRLVAVGGGWRRLVAGGWWLEAVGSGWQLVVGRRWRLAAVGGWRLVAVGGWRLVAVGS